MELLAIRDEVWLLTENGRTGNMQDEELPEFASQFCFAVVKLIGTKNIMCI